MNILLPKYALNYNLMPFKTEEEVEIYNFSTTHSKDIQYDYVIHWGYQPYIPNLGAKYGIMETGFFNEGAFIDTIGSYHTASLNTKHAYDIISQFELGSRKSAKDIIFNLPSYKQSKYNADYAEKDKKNLLWDKIVLAVQNPSDRAIQAITNTKKYYDFLEDCCKFYGKNLFVKLHPWNSGEVYNIIVDIAKRYKCEWGKTNMTIIENCDFVISYNSTFAIDCILRDIPYVQYGLGTFYNTFGINYSNHKFPLKIDKIPNSINLANFLIHKYSFNKTMSKERFAKMINHFSESSDVFPMTDEYSYASTTCI
jgi:hypothetical protein